MAHWKLLVDDNFNWQDESKSYEFGVFDTLAESVTACMEIVDSELCCLFKDGMGAEELFELYSLFGEDPFIRAVDPAQPPSQFSSNHYARSQCAVVVERARAALNRRD